MTERLSAYAPQALAVLRIVTALLFFQSGLFHLFNFPATNFPPPPPEMATLLFAAGILEFVGGLLLIVGFLTRPTAFVLTGMMAVAYWGFHAPMSPWPVANMGATAILYCFVFLQLVFAGPGAWALDNLRRSRAASDRSRLQPA
jgi:putative oxidoreductase